MIQLLNLSSVKIIVLTLFCYIPVSHGNLIQIEEKTQSDSTAFFEIYKHLRYFHPDSESMHPNWDIFLNNKICEADFSNVEVAHLQQTFSFLPEVNFSVLPMKDIEAPEEYSSLYFNHYVGYKESTHHLYSLKREKAKTFKTQHIQIHDSLYLSFPAYSPNKKALISPPEETQTNDEHCSDIFNFIKIFHTLELFFHNSPNEINNTLFEHYLARVLKAPYDKRMKIIRELISSLNECHFKLYKSDSDYSERMLVPIQWEFNKKKDGLIVLRSVDQTLEGVTVTKINDVGIPQLYQSKAALISSANERHKMSQIKDYLQLVNDSIIHITYLDKDSVEKKKKITSFFSILEYYEWEILPENQRPNFKAINNKTDYINLTKASHKAISHHYSQHGFDHSGKYLFLDLRGRPTEKSFHKLLSLFYPVAQEHLFLTIPNTNIDTTYFSEHPWGIYPGKNTLKYKKIYVLIDENTVSYGESVAYMLARLDNTTLIGYYSAGCNGDVTTVNLDGYVLRFTGAKVQYPHVPTCSEGKMLKPDYFFTREELTNLNQVILDLITM